jgi:hypothetical protein
LDFSKGSKIHFSLSLLSQYSIHRLLNDTAINMPKKTETKDPKAAADKKAAGKKGGADKGANKKGGKEGK